MLRLALTIALILSAGMLTACLKRTNVQCDQSSNCDLSPGGVCTRSPTGNQWCAYPDSTCPSGLVYSTQAVGDGISGTCVADAGSPADAGNTGDANNTECKVRLAFEEGAPSIVQPSREVWTADADGANPINISKSPTSDDYSATWSPDGSRLAFLSNRSGVYHIYVVNADGTNLVNLTPSSTDSSSVPLWSPDGSHIAFFRGQRAWVMKTDGTGAAPVSDRQVFEVWLAWSPDGQQLAYAIPSPPPGPGTFGPILLYVSAIQNASPRKLSTFTAGFESHVSWAPAQKIVWDIDKDVFVANADGSSLLNVTQDAAHSNTTPRLTPDGETIVFRSDISGRAELWSVAVSGGVKIPLTHNAIMASTSTDAAGDLPSGISSDGLLVAFTRKTPGASPATSTVGVVDIRGTTTHLFNAPGGMYAASPTFSPCPGPKTTLALQGTPHK